MSTDPSKLIPAAPAAATGGLLPWLPWIGAAVVLGVVGATAGVLGVFGTPAPVKASTAIVLGSGVEALDCPGGAPVAQLVGGERVLALKRSDDSHYLEVRDPYNLNQLVWLPAGLVSVDKHQPDIASLETAGCSKPTLALDALPVAPVVPSPPASTSPTKPTKPGGGAPPPPADTMKPVLVKGNASPATVVNGQLITLNATATDNVGVSSVTVSWSGEESGSATMHLVLGAWQYSFSSSTTDSGNITFSFVAHDAAGNTSAPVTAVVNHQYLG